MLRTHTCGELRATHIDQKVTLCGWVQRIRNLGAVCFIDLRDRYGITQLTIEESEAALFEKVTGLGREYVVRVSGTVIARSSINKEIPTGDIEILISEIEVLNASETPPFTIETETDGGEELRMNYRYLDLRRPPLQSHLRLRHEMALAVRNYLSEKGFLEIETPYLIRSTPEGARDFVVPSRMHEGSFYALPQSPQLFKQLLMTGGYDKYFQIVRCFRDEDLRADRQPEFTQIDCEMAFVEQEDILEQFSGLLRYILKEIKEVEIQDIPVISYADAMQRYGSDKPDIRFGIELSNLTTDAQGRGFKVFDDAAVVVGLAIPQGSNHTRKQIDALIDWVKQPQVGAKGLVWVKCLPDNTFKSSVDKFFDEKTFTLWKEKTKAKEGDLICIMSGAERHTYNAMGAFRLHLGKELGLRDPNIYAPVWVVDFPLFEKDEETNAIYPMHHPFTSPKAEHLSKLAGDPDQVCANAYDLVLNGNEIGGGSIRIHDAEIQQQIFDALGMSKDEAESQFGFLMRAFRYGAPPHGGIAFGFDRLVALLGGSETIRDFIAFPKNNAGKDLMIDAPASISDEQRKELGL